MSVFLFKSMENEKIHEFSGEGLTVSEKRWGKQLYDDYLISYPHLNQLSDLRDLESLVFHEALDRRYRKEMGKQASKTDKRNKAVPKYYVDNINKNNDQIFKLKERLGLMQDKKNLDVYQDWKSLKEKFKIWREKNLGSRKVTCPFCSEIFFLMIRTDKYDEKKFPFFKDKILCNEHLHKIYKEGRIIKEEYAEILGTSPDYIDWIDEKWFQKLPETVEEVIDVEKSS